MSVATETRAVAGLTAAFMAHRAELRAFLSALCRAREGDADVDDVLQELWLRCAELDASQVRDARAYLYRMGQNIVLDRFRHAARGRNYETDWGYVHNQTEGGGEEAMVERSLIAREGLNAVDHALRSVGERAAWIFQRYKVDGIHQHRIAAELGVSLSTVEKDLRKAYEAVVALRGGRDEE